MWFEHIFETALRNMDRQMDPGIYGVCKFLICLCSSSLSYFFLENITIGFHVLDVGKHLQKGSTENFANKPCKKHLNEHKSQIWPKIKLCNFNGICAL